MAHTISKKAKAVYFVVSTLPITDVRTGADHTARFVREQLREHLFGGEKATVRRLTRYEVSVMELARDALRLPSGTTTCEGGTRE